VSEWNLVCGEAWKQQAVNTGFFFGFLLGAGFFGWLSDYAGRKKAIIASGAAAGCAGMLCGTAGGYWTFFLFRAVTGFGVGGIGMAGYVLGCEFVGPSWRGLLVSPPLAALARHQCATIFSIHSNDMAVIAICTAPLQSAFTHSICAPVY
jgi:MFS family permease